MLLKLPPLSVTHSHSFKSAKMWSVPRTNSYPMTGRGWWAGTSGGTRRGRSRWTWRGSPSTCGSSSRGRRPSSPSTSRGGTRRRRYSGRDWWTFGAKILFCKIVKQASLKQEPLESGYLTKRDQSGKSLGKKSSGMRCCYIEFVSPVGTFLIYRVGTFLWFCDFVPTLYCISEMHLLVSTKVSKYELYTMHPRIIITNIIMKV